MLFPYDYDDDFINSRDNSVTISSKCRKVTIQKGSAHILPVVNQLSMAYVTKKRKVAIAEVPRSSNYPHPSTSNGLPRLVIREEKTTLTVPR